MQRFDKTIATAFKNVGRRLKTGQVRRPANAPYSLKSSRNKALETNVISFDFTFSKEAIVEPE